MATPAFTPMRQENGRLTAICDAGYCNKFKQRMWTFKCDCGNVIDLPRTRVFAKKTDVTSCGCWRKERMKQMHEEGKLDHVKWPAGICQTPNPKRWITQLRMPNCRFAPKGYAPKRIIRFDGGSI